MYYLLSISFVITVIIIFYFLIKGYIRSLKLDKNQESINILNISGRSETPNEYFKKVIKVIIKIFLKRMSYYFNFFTHYTLFLFLKIVYFVKVLSEKFYDNFRDYVIIKSAKDKSYIKFFWKSLKKYKRERDKDVK